MCCLSRKSITTPNETINKHQINNISFVESYLTHPTGEQDIKCMPKQVNQLLSETDRASPSQQVAKMYSQQVQLLEAIPSKQLTCIQSLEIAIGSKPACNNIVNTHKSDKNRDYDVKFAHTQTNQSIVKTSQTGQYHLQITDICSGRARASETPYGETSETTSSASEPSSIDYPHTTTDSTTNDIMKASPIQHS